LKIAIRLRLISILALALTGAMLTGQGAWIHVKAELAQVLLQRAWSKALEGEHRPAPWPWADTWPVARLESRRLGIDQLVLAQASGRNLAFGATHVPPSALPGLTGHSVISGHRDTHFRFLGDLQPGDILNLESLQQSASFEVIGSEIIDLDQQQLNLAPDRDLLTLVTCYPFDAVLPGTPLRYLVHARRKSRAEPPL
jgi:sortase A